MNQRQRIDAAFGHREPDRTPLFEYVLKSPVADLLLGRPYVADHDYGEAWATCVKDRGWAGAVRQMAVDQLDLAARLGWDMMYAIFNPRQVPIPQAPPLAADTDDPVERIRRYNERSRQRDGTMPDEMFLVYRLLKEEMARRGMDLPIMAPAYTHGLWTDVNLMQTMLLEPEVAHDYFALRTRAGLWLVEKFASVGVDMVGIGGDFAGNRPLISPATYHKFIMPEVRKVSRRAHELGLRTINASDGNLWSVLDDFLIHCEVDGYAEVDQRAGMDLARLKREYGSEATFLGNLDCGNILSFGTVAEVRQHAVDCIEAGQGHGGHIFCASNAITASVPLRNYLAVQAAYREVFGLPPLELPAGMAADGAVNENEPARR